MQPGDRQLLVKNISKVAKHQQGREHQQRRESSIKI